MADIPVAALPRLVASIAAAALLDSRSRPFDWHDVVQWTAQTRLDAPGIEADSLDRLTVAAALNAFFHLHVSGLEDYLLRHRQLGEMAELVAEARGRTPGCPIGFQTSGSQGTPQKIDHSLHDLRQEVAALAQLFPEARRIIGFVPPHHIYGFLFTVLLPERLDVPFLEGRAWGPGRMAAEMARGDVLIAHPVYWDFIDRSLDSVPAGVIGVNSTGPLSQATETSLRTKGLGRLIAIYGSTETGGLGWREAPESYYRPLPHLALVRVGETEWGFRPRLAAANGGSLNAHEAPIQPPDLLDSPDSETFRPVKRRDTMVKIGGERVYPLSIAERLATHPAIAACTVRLATQGKGAGRLKAFVVPKDPEGDPEQLRQTLNAWATETLRPAERPASWMVGTALPRNAMGKLADWND